ncbi:MAG: glycerol-3-phosphate 1-O-acyltransferase PlsY [Anaplasmataceae bacterium]|nr:glycerol-3-phosphate 1-O-acyltransferase PlsY [Anaplasmataceae bacterium]
MENNLIFIFIIVCYLFASIPFGLILMKFLYKIDITKEGSGNYGATNIFRVSNNKKIGLITLLFDGCKALLPCCFIKFYYHDQFLLAITGLFAIIGHIFPIYNKFKGGKGVATFLGFLLVFDFSIAINTIMTWVLTFQYKRMSSLSSIASITLSIISVCIYYKLDIIIIYLAIYSVIMYKHRDNIIRLFKGRENKF